MNPDPGDAGRSRELNRSIDGDSPRVEINLRPMMIQDFAQVRALWEADPGIHMGVGDDERGIAQYLERNPTTSFVAVKGGEVVGAILCGHDGRRGFLSHLIVRPEFRGCGIGKQLIAASCEALQVEGIEMVLGIVLKSNEAGQQFWADQGWETADYVEVISRKLEEGR